MAGRLLADGRPGAFLLLRSRLQDKVKNQEKESPSAGAIEEWAAELCAVRHQYETSHTYQIRTKIFLSMPLQKSLEIVEGC